MATGHRTFWIFVITALVARAQQPRIDLTHYSADSGVVVRTNAELLEVAWPMERGEAGRMQLSLRPGESLIQMLGCASSTSAQPKPVLTNLQPVFFMTVGTRVAPPGRPPEMSKWNTFFDNPSKRPHQNFASKLDLKRVLVTSEGRRATVTIGDLAIGISRGGCR